MKKRTIIILFVMASILLYGIYWAFYDMGRLPKGKLINEVESPDGKYSIKAYLSESSLSAPAILCELNYNTEKRKSKNIYWNYRESHADIKWIDNTTVLINGKELNIEYDTYDWRRK